MFIDISKDRIVLYGEEEKIVLPFFEVEKNISQILIDKYRQCPFEKVYCITGPGTFTNMRVAVLAIQSLNYFLEDKITYYTIDKFSLYRAMYADAILPLYGIVSIGQRKKVALLNCDTGLYEKIPTQTLSDMIANKNDKRLSENSFFMDDCYGEDFSSLQQHTPSLDFSYTHGEIFCHRDHAKNNITDYFVHQDSLNPFYLESL